VLASRRHRLSSITPRRARRWSRLSQSIQAEAFRAEVINVDRRDITSTGFAEIHHNPLIYIASILTRAATILLGMSNRRAKPHIAQEIGHHHHIAGIFPTRYA